MYPKISNKLLPEECQEYTLFLQPGLQPFLIAATAARIEAEKAEADERPSITVIAFIAIFQSVSNLVAWLWRKLRRRGAMELPANLVQQPK